MRVCKHGCDVKDLHVLLRLNFVLKAIEQFVRKGCEKVMQTRDYVSGLHNCLEFPKITGTGKSTLLLNYKYTYILNYLLLFNYLLLVISISKLYISMVLPFIFDMIDRRSYTHNLSSCKVKV